MFLWDESKIRFLRDASEYTPFNDVLAGKIVPHLNENSSVLDAGCGLGYLSLALSPYCKSITAMDVSGEALSVLKENIASRNVSNITVSSEDVFHLSDESKFDSIVFCFFGSVTESLSVIKKHCKGKAFLFKKNWSTHRFSLKETRLEKFTYIKTCQELNSLGIPFESECFDVDMGQPFRSLDDAALFFHLHDRSELKTEVSTQDFEKLLKHNNDPKFPYYLISKRPVGMIIIDAKNL